MMDEKLLNTAFEQHVRAVQTASKEFDENDRLTENLDCIEIFKNPECPCVCLGIYYVCRWGQDDDSEQFAAIREAYKRIIQNSSAKITNIIYQCRPGFLLQLIISRATDQNQAINTYIADMLRGFVMPPAFCPLNKYVNDMEPMTAQGERRRDGYVESDSSYTQVCVSPKLIDIKGWLRKWLLKE